MVVGVGDIHCTTGTAAHSGGMIELAFLLRVFNYSMPIADGLSANGKDWEGSSGIIKGEHLDAMVADVANE